MASDPTPAQSLAAQRWGMVGELICAHCGKSFTGRLAYKPPRYCSGNCRQKAMAERKRRGESGTTKVGSISPPERRETGQRRPNP